MGFYDDKDNVLKYIEMSKEYTGFNLIQVLSEYLEKGLCLLELGMGPGKDLDILSKLYNVTGSDNSQIFLDLYRKRNEDANVILLDACTVNTTNSYDCIYSNKVLQHLTKKELTQSISNQHRVLNSKGLIFHTFWYGNGTEDYNGLRFSYYQEDDLDTLFNNSNFSIIEVSRYKEDKDGDSIYVLARRK